MSRKEGSDLLRAEDIMKLEVQLNKIRDWLTTKKEEQDKKAFDEDRVLLTADVLRRVCFLISAFTFLSRKLLIEK